MKIKLNLNNYEPIPEGEQVLEITKAECKPSGKPTGCSVTFKDGKGRMLTNKYDFNNPTGLTIFAILCRHALGMQDMEEFDTAIDTPKLVGKKVVCEIVHNQGTQPREDGTYPIFANIKKILSGVEEVKPSDLSEDDLLPKAMQTPRAQIASSVGDDL